MSLSIALYASYLTYKADTNQVVSFLAETGQKCGFSLKAPTQNAKRLKGKARASARAEEQQPLTTGNVVSTSMFVPLAQRIAGTTRQIKEIPRHIALALDRAIATRKEHSTHHKLQENRKQPTVHEDGVEGHVAFINILEDVRTILKPLYPKHLDPLPSKAELRILTNRFQDLKVEQPSLVSEGSTIPEVPSFAPTASIETKYEAEIVDDYDEAFIAACCLIEDLNEIRDFLRKSWKAYIWQNTDLATVSAVTDHALAFVRKDIDDFGKRFTKHADLTAFIQDMFSSHCGDLGLTPNGKSVPIDFSAAVAADTSFLWIQSLWKETWKKAPSLTASYPGAPSWQRQGLFDAKTTFETQKEFLASFLPDYRLITSRLALPAFKGALPALDSLTIGLQQLARGGEVSFWMLFSLQIFLDIREELGSHNNRGFEDLVCCVAAIEDEIGEHLSMEDFYSMHGQQYWPTEFKTSIIQLLDRTSIIKQDFINSMITEPDLKTYLNTPTASPRGNSNYAFLKQHPWLCGILAFSMEGYALQSGIELCNVRQLALPAAHLYNALLSNGHLDEQWPDMEMLIEHQGEKNLFVGGRPSDMLDCLKKFELSRGLSIIEFASNSRLTGPAKVDEKRRRKLGTENMPMTHVLLEDYCNTDRNNLVNASKALRQLTHTGKKRNFDASKTKVADWLKLLLHNTHEESHKRRFSYFSIDRTSRDILNQLASVLNPNPYAMHDPGAADCEDIRSLADNVSRLLENAAHVKKKENKRGGNYPFDLNRDIANPNQALGMTAGSIRGLLSEDITETGVNAAVYTIQKLANSLQRGGPPDLRVHLKTLLFIHASKDEAIQDIDNFYNNRGGDYMLKSLTPGQRLVGSSSSAPAFEMPADVPGYKFSNAPGPSSTAASASAGASFATAKKAATTTGSPTKIGAPASATAVKPTIQAKKPAATPNKPKKKLNIKEFMASLPAGAKDNLPKVNLKPMFREMMEDGILDALEQIMLMRTGK